MKKTTISICLAAIVVFAGCKGRNTAKQTEATVVETTAPDMHTSQNSLDYEGTYKGILPCADCEGIETTLTIDRAGNYTRTMKYLGKGDGTEFTETGKYKWSSDGRIIELEGLDHTNLYQVGENMLFSLDGDGQRITGDLAGFYILSKQ